MEGSFFTFKILCLGSYEGFPHKVTISYDGTANIKYKDICREPTHYAKVALVEYEDAFEVNDDGSIVEYPVDFISPASELTYGYEYIKPFFEIYDIVPIWYDANGTYGWYDEETGGWTGATGMV